MVFKNPKLLYEYDALEPFIDKETMEIHHTKHHQNYTNNLNTLSSAVASYLDLHELLANIEENDNLSSRDKGILLKHGGGHFNHCLFFHLLGKDKKTISENLEERIKIDFGSMEGFQAAFTEAAMSVFGSGWCWLVYDGKLSNNKLLILTTQNQICPIMTEKNLVPILCLDLWEHAYYLKFRSSRKDFINTWWEVVNWEMASAIYERIALKGLKLGISKDGYLMI